MKALVPALLFVVVLLASCSKEERLREKYSGLYAVKSMERTWYDSTGTDSVVTNDDVGTLGLYNNDNNPFNNVVFQLAPWPPSWENNLVGGFFHTEAVGWYTDDVDGSTITFFSNDDASAFFHAVYTVEHSGAKSYTWTFVETDANDRMAYREVWKVTRQ